MRTSTLVSNGSGAVVLMCLAFACSGGEHASPATQDLDAAGAGDSGDVDAGPADSGTPPQSDASAPHAQARAFALDDGVDLAAVDGLAIRSGWRTLEPSEGTYDWERIDASLAKVKAQGKLATLHVLGGGYANTAPLWLKPAVPFYSYDFAGRSGEEPIPWDTVYLDKWSAFLTKLAAHLQSSGYQSLVVNVSVAVPIPEMNLIGCSGGMLDSKTTPYDRAKYLAAWKRMIDLYQTTFPNVTRFISAPQKGICRDDNDTAFYPELLDYALAKDPSRVQPFAADLSAEGSGRLNVYSAYSAKSSFAFQPVAAFSDDPNHWVKGTLLQLYCAGRAANGRYFEVYSKDLQNADPAVQRGIASIHDPSLCP